MQDMFLQQVKGLLGVAPPHLSFGPSVPKNMSQDALRQPSPTDNREAGPKTGSKRAGESSRSRNRSGDPSPSEHRDGRSLVVAVIHSALTKSLTDRAQDHLPGGIESVVEADGVIPPTF